MKYYLFFLILLLGILSCKKESEILGDNYFDVKGNYLGTCWTYKSWLDIQTGLQIKERDTSDARFIIDRISFNKLKMKISGNTFYGYNKPGQDTLIYSIDELHGRIQIIKIYHSQKKLTYSRSDPYTSGQNGSFFQECVCEKM